MPRRTAEQFLSDANEKAFEKSLDKPASIPDLLNSFRKKYASYGIEITGDGTEKNPISIEFDKEVFPPQDPDEYEQTKLRLTFLLQIIARRDLGEANLHTDLSYEDLRSIAMTIDPRVYRSYLRQAIFYSDWSAFNFEQI